MNTKHRTIFIGLIVGLGAVFVLSLALGSVSIPLRDVVTILLGGEGTRSTYTTIILNFRLTKAITAALAGAALGVSGLIMQTLFRNPLADPYVLGISSGASLGVAFVVLLAGTTGTTLLAGVGLLGDFALIAASSIGAASVLILILIAARRVSGTMTLLILGLMFGYAASALVSLLIHFSVADRIQTYISWTFGSFGGVTWGQMPLYAAGLLIGLGSANLSAKPLNALLLGDVYARSMGLDVRRVRMWLISSAALLTGIITAFCGPIGFLGVAVPHLCRVMLGTSDHRILLPAVTITGAALAMIADIIAQAPGTATVLPLNAITALFGAPVVLWVILRRRDVRETFAS